MIDAFVTTCLKRRGIVWLVFAMAAGYGAWCWTQLPLEAYPDIADTTSQVVTQVPGLAAEEVEKQITIPLEREIMGTPGMYVMRSKSTFGLSLITVVFRDGAEDYWSRQRLQERIGGVALPYSAQPGLDALTSPIGEIYRYTLESKTRDLRELSELQRWKVIPRLKQVAGVADVSNFGGLTTQFMVEFDPAKLSKYNITLAQVTQAINANNSSAGGSVLTRGQQGFVVRGVGLISGLDDLAQIVVSQKNGVPVLVKDLGEVKLGNKERQGILGKDSNPDTIEGVTLLLKGENPSTVLDGVHEAVRDLNDNVLPQDVKVVPYLDRTMLVQATVHTVGKTLLEGMTLVTLVLLLFLGSPRAALIVALTIPMSLLTAFAFMHQLKIPANLLSLGAIDFGIVVDAAIVVMENILRQREAHADRPLKPRDVLKATLQVTRPIFFGMVVIITAYTPLFAFQRIEYKLFAPMAFAIGFALVGALAVGLLLIPGLAYLAYRKPRRVFHNRALEALGHWYEQLLRRIVGQRALTLAAFALAFVCVIGAAATIGRDFLPYLDEGSLWLQVTLPPGISLDKATQMSNRLRDAAREFDEVSYVVTQLGRNDDGTDPWTASHIEVSVGLHPQAEWKSGLSKQELISGLAARFAQLPGTQVGFTQPMIDGVLDKLAGAHSDLVVKIYGNDFKETRRIASEIDRVLSAVPGAADVIIDQEPPLPQLRIEVDRAAAARYGINVADIADLIGTGIGGAPVAQLFVDERRYDIAVRFTPQSRSDPDAIGRLVLSAPGGAKVALSQVATLRLDDGESTITREMGKRHLTVRLNLRGRDLSSFLEDAHAQIEAKVKYDHAHIQLAWGGQFENQQRAQARLMLIMPMVIVLMFALLFAQFKNLWQPSLILLAVPLGALGGFVALHLRDMTLNVSSAVGFIALFGVTVMNGIIMVSNLNRLRVEEKLPLREAVIQGARERFRPVLMTATVAALGLLPAALAHGLGSDVQRPLATVVVGGLVTATGLTLVWLPALYYLVASRLEAMNARHAQAHADLTDPAGAAT
ncbi:CusA/CzcA family heavy metal efflux RND transporter [Variovorax sp. LG9.2]|uniref:efflux RND transporter permease subunit n=1 Tax=Variovorax sp. LG9.2 TaxID=3048626 RepID=UPI002B22ADB4|nr:CusA/CzcA family heavy metal efflux RND transporter [Variovorax sp. LG9.2]MEB0055863.1 CusA/CzcA family heavy metal efflux RND transporter [Variovorax sp. LG9.2]